MLNSSEGGRGINGRKCTIYTGQGHWGWSVLLYLISWEDYNHSIRGNSYKKCTIQWIFKNMLKIHIYIYIYMHCTYFFKANILEANSNLTIQNCMRRYNIEYEVLNYFLKHFYRWRNWAQKNLTHLSKNF